MDRERRAVRVVYHRQRQRARRCRGRHLVYLRLGHVSERRYLAVLALQDNKTI